MKTTQNMGNKRVSFRGLLLSGFILSILFILGVLSISDGYAMVKVGEGADSQAVVIVHQQSQILKTPWKVVRVAVTDPTVADVKVLTPDQVLVQGLSIGTTDIILWNEDETQILQKKVTVVLDEEAFAAMMTEMFPRSELAVSQSGGSLIIQGHHRNTLHAQQLHDYLDKAKIAYIDMTDVSGVQQVQLQVRVAEVTKIGLRSLGVQWIQAGSDFISGIAPGGPLADDITFTPGSIDSYEVGDAVTAFGHVTSADLVFFLDALQENQYLRLLANPTLIALSGEEASFLAGGEYPIPVPQSGTGTAATITIEYKEYGVRLNFRPTVLGDNTIKLYAAPEVSELDYTNSTSINGTPVPGVLTRRVETTIELKSGQSFAIAGLLKDTVTATNSSIPGLGNLPVLGPLFRSVSYQQGETELLILVTVNLVEPLDINPQATPLPGFLHESPNDWELYIDGKLESGEPAKLNAAEAEWLTRIGLRDLKGPGAWDSYGTSAPPSSAELNPTTE